MSFYYPQTKLCKYVYDIRLYISYISFLASLVNHESLSIFIISLSSSEIGFSLQKDQQQFEMDSQSCHDVSGKPVTFHF